jgi:hypothetical protein
MARARSVALNFFARKQNWNEVNQERKRVDDVDGDDEQVDEINAWPA